MSRVAITREKLDDLALHVSAKSGEDMPLTIDGMMDAVDGIDLDDKFIVTIHHTTDQKWVGSSVDFIPDCTFTELEAIYRSGKKIVFRMDRSQIGEYSYAYADGYIEEFSGPEPYILANYTVFGSKHDPDLYDGRTYEWLGVLDSITYTWGENLEDSDGYIFVSNQDYGIAPWGTFNVTADNIGNGLLYISSYNNVRVPIGTAGTPTATKGTVSNHAINVTPSVTNTAGYITGGTVTGTAVSVSASELVSGTLPITSSGTKDVTNYASASVAAGGATASATKGTVSNHSVTVTPSVTRTAGYVTAGTSSGTAVTVSASELVSGSETKTENGTYDVTNLAELVVDVQSSTPSLHVGTASATSSTGGTLVFDELDGVPTSIAVIANGTISTSSTPTFSAIACPDLTSSLHGSVVVDTANAQVSYVGSGFYINSTGSQSIEIVGFQAGGFSTTVPYDLIYTYGGGAIDTKQAQVGSGATSITFTGLEDEPACWYVLFQSNFGTSSGYQRVIAVANDGTDTYGLEMDSAAHYSDQHWTSSYSNGSLTITSQGTNAGGYFHQPGTYLLVYAYDASGNYQSKTVTPSQSTQEVTADSGYDALRKVTVNPIPSEYIVPTGNLAITSNTASGQSLDVSHYATATVNVPTSGSSMNVQVAQSTTRIASTTYTKTASLTCAVSGTYDVYWDCFRSTTSGTSGSQLYIGDTASGSANTTFSNHAQNNHRTGVHINANQEVAVYVRSRATNYYAYCGQLTIVQTA